MINIQKKDQVHDKDEPDPPDYSIFKAIKTITKQANTLRYLLHGQ